MGNNQVIYEYNRLVASCAQDSYVAKRWIAICGTMYESDLIKHMENLGFSKDEAKYFINGINNQHLDSESSKDLAHEAIQLAAFTEQSWSNSSGTSDILHYASHYINSAGFENFENEEFSFKEDVDSGRYDDTDFNSDLDAQNVYQLQLNANQEDLFKVDTQYNNGIQTNTINRVDEFYAYYGDGDISQGKEEVHFIIEDLFTMGSSHIKGDYSDAENINHQNDFFDYLDRGEYLNVK